VYDDFLGKVVAKAREVRADDGAGSQIGPITMPGQIDVIRRHIDDALARGGRAVLGGPEAVGDRFVQPTILVDVPEDAAAVQEETFGPTMTVTRVRDMDEAVRLANSTRYGLGSTVFSKARGMEIASRIRSGMTAINSVISFAGIPSLPFGGIGDSGFGRIHGPDGLKEFTYAHAISRRRFTAPLELTTFARTAKQDKQFLQLLTMLHGRSTTLGRTGSTVGSPPGTSPGA
jgi:aldehyde dehydrogenase (NAD+)